MPIAVIEKPRSCSTNIAQPAGSFGTEEEYSSGNTITSRRSFRSRRGDGHDRTPVAPQNAAFPTYKAPRVHHAPRRRGGDVAARGARAAGGAGEAHRRAHEHNCGSSGTALPPPVIPARTPHPLPRATYL